MQAPSPGRGPISPLNVEYESGDEAVDDIWDDDCGGLENIASAAKTPPGYGESIFGNFGVKGELNRPGVDAKGELNRSVRFCFNFFGRVFLGARFFWWERDFFSWEEGFFHLEFNIWKQG